MLRFALFLLRWLDVTAFGFLLSLLQRLLARRLRAALRIYDSKCMVVWATRTFVLSAVTTFLSLELTPAEANPNPKVGRRKPNKQSDWRTADRRQRANSPRVARGRLRATTGAICPTKTPPVGGVHRNHSPGNQIAD
ncbi:hypothetical protein PYCC9005_003521 [Savitreella phatthalungensis]